MDKKAFTLIELLVVVLIIGILASVALPQYKMAVEKSRIAEVLVVVRKMKQNYEMALLQGNSSACYNDPACLLDETSLTLKSDWSDNPEIHHISGNNWGLVATGKNFNYMVTWLVGYGIVSKHKPDADIDYGFVYTLGSGATRPEFVCLGGTDFGKRICKSLCGFDSCNMDTKTAK